MTRVQTPLAAGNFWYEYTFPKGVVVNEDRLEINVPKARELKLKAPNRKPEMAATEATIQTYARFTLLSIKLGCCIVARFDIHPPGTGPK